MRAIQAHVHALHLERCQPTPHVRLHRALRQATMLGDLLVGQPAVEGERQHLALCGRQAFQQTTHLRRAVFRVLERDTSRDRYCEELRRPARRFEQMTGQPMAPAFRAPGGHTSPALLCAARACGFKHVPWSAAGFLGDELASARASNAALLAKALHNIRPGDILLAHLASTAAKIRGHRPTSSR